MAIQRLLRPLAAVSQWSRTGLRCFSCTSHCFAQTIEVRTRVEQQRAATSTAAEREEQWQSYRQHRRRRRLRNFTFFSIPLVVIYSQWYLHTDQNLEKNLAKLPKLRQLVQDAESRPLRDSYAEVNLDKRVFACLTDETLRSRWLLGPKRAFWSHSKQELLQFQWFGILLGGWPSIVHGGAIATALSEALSRAAVCIEPTSEPIPEPTSLSLTYLKPTRVLSYYLIRVKPLEETETQAAGPSLPPMSSALDREGHEIGPSKDLTKQPLPSEPPTNDDEYLQLEATLEDIKTGKVLVKARASFPKNRPG